MAALADRLAALRRERAAFLDALEALTPSQRASRPAPEAWAPLEVGEHVYRVEAVTLRGLEEQIAAGDARKEVGSHSRASIILLLAAMRSPTRIGMPEGARGIAPEGMEYAALRVTWAALAGRWTALAAALPEALVRTPLVRHPVAGALTLDDALRFLVAHASRHRRRLDGARRAARNARKGENIPARDV